MTEAKDVAGGTAEDRFTRYEYGPSATTSFGGSGTQQTKKTVRQGLDDTGSVVEEDTYTYNLQGRMASAEVKEYDGQTLHSHTKSEYTYDDNGIRVTQTVRTDVNKDGDFSDAEDTTVATNYLNDGNNPTGYSQVLEERVSGNVTKSYTLGLDVIAQQAPAIASGGNLFLLYDGHGSTRGLVDSAGQPLSGQVFRYDAYGNRLDSADALTTLLYSGEQTDGTGLQYLRARYYDPNTGRFNRLDPFAGDTNDPLSLHKYLYCHGDGINFNDPSGQSEGMVGLMVTVAIGAAINLMSFPNIANAPTPGDDTALDAGGDMAGAAVTEILLAGPTHYVFMFMSGAARFVYARVFGRAAVAVEEGAAGAAERTVMRRVYNSAANPVGDKLKGDALALPGHVDDIMVIGRQADTQGWLGKAGSMVLNLPKKAWTVFVNDGWMERGIMEGRKFRLATKPSFATLRRIETSREGDTIRELTIFHRELKALRANGYVRQGDMMVPGPNWVRNRVVKVRPPTVRSDVVLVEDVWETAR